MLDLHANAASVLDLHAEIFQDASKRLHQELSARPMAIPSVATISIVTTLLGKLISSALDAYAQKAVLMGEAFEDAHRDAIRRFVPESLLEAVVTLAQHLEDLKPAGQ